MTGDDRDLQMLDRDLRELRALDPAHTARPDAGREPAAQAMLGRVLEQPRDIAPSADAVQIGDRRPVRRWVLVGAAAAAVAAGLVVLPPWGTPEQAFATWTAVPEEVPDALVGELGPKCSTGLAGTSGAGERDVVLAEERGKVTFLVMLSSGMVEHCLLVDGEFSSAGSSSRMGIPAELPPTEVHTFIVAGGGRGDGAYTAVTGRVGAEVVGVEVHPRGTLVESGALPGGELPESIEATIANGYYGAWWPGIGPEDLDLTVHLADGSVIEGVPAFDNEG